MQIPITVPDGVSGDWTVSSFTVSSDDAKRFNLRQYWNGHPKRSIDPGDYKRLSRGNILVMTNTPAEIRDHLLFIQKAKESRTVLINGLGLGVALKAILDSSQVQKVTVVEQSQDVINLVAPSYQDERVKIIKSDAFNYTPPKGPKIDVVWHDIWDDITSDNIDQMSTLHRKYGRRANWQGSWCKKLCQNLRRSSQRRNFSHLLGY